MSSIIANRFGSVSHERTRFLCVVLLWATGWVQAQMVQVPGEWYDRDKYTDDAGGRLGWWFYADTDPALGYDDRYWWDVGDSLAKHMPQVAGWPNGWHDPHPKTDTGWGWSTKPRSEWTWTSPITGVIWRPGYDGTCWLASADNLYRFLTGRPSKYHGWAYTGDWPRGTKSDGDRINTWQWGGEPLVALREVGLDGQARHAHDGSWSSDPTDAIRDLLSLGLPVSLGVTDKSGDDFKFSSHLITLYAIDTRNRQLIIACSDTESGGDFGTFGYQFGPYQHPAEQPKEGSSDPWPVHTNVLRILDWVDGHHRINSYRTVALNHWQGAGTGGDLSTGGPTSEWNNAANWSSGRVPEDIGINPEADFSRVPRVTFENAGLVEVRTVDARAARLMLEGAHSHVMVLPGASLELGTLFVNDTLARGLEVAGTVSAHRADLVSGTLRVIGGNIKIEAMPEGVAPNVTCQGASAIELAAGGAVLVTGGLGVNQDSGGLGRLFVNDDGFGSGGRIRIGGDVHVSDGSGLIINSPHVTVDVDPSSVVQVSGFLNLIRGEMAIAGLLQAGSGSGSEVTIAGGTLTAASTYLGRDPGHSTIMTLETSDGVHPAFLTTGAGNILYVGYQGNGEVRHRAGTLSRKSVTDAHPDLVLGYGNGTLGTYTLTDGSVTVDLLRLGVGGTGRFVHDGGDVVIHGALAFSGADSLGDNQYRLNAGSLTLNVFDRTVDGTGRFEYNGGELHLLGTDHVLDKLIVGMVQGADVEFVLGNQDLGGQALTAHLIVLGDGGIGRLVQGGPSTVKAGKIFIGGLVDSPQNYYLHQGGTVTVSGDLIIGNALPGHGQFIMAGGVADLELETGATWVGELGHGRFDQGGGKHRTELLEVGAIGQGRYVQRGGSLATDLTRVRQQGAWEHVSGLHEARDLRINSIHEPAGGGGYLMVGPAALLDVVGVYVGDEWDGTLGQSAGTATVNQDMVLGYGRGAIGIVEQTGGTNLTMGDIYVAFGSGSSGRYNLGGGLTEGIAQTIHGNLRIGHGEGSDGSYTVTRKLYHVGGWWTHEGHLTVHGDIHVGGAGAGQLELAGKTTANGTVWAGGHTGPGRIVLDGTSLAGAGDLAIRAGTGTLVGRGMVEMPVTNDGLIELPDSYALRLLGGLTIGAGATLDVGDGSELMLRGGGTLAGTFMNRGFVNFSGGTFDLNTTVARGAGTGGAVAIDSGTLNLNAAFEAARLDVRRPDSKLWVGADVTVDSLTVGEGATLRQHAGRTRANALVLDRDIWVDDQETWYELLAGSELVSGTCHIGAEFLHAGLQHEVSLLSIGFHDLGYHDPLPGRYTLTGGSLRVHDLVIGAPPWVDPWWPEITAPPAPGTFHIVDPTSHITVSGSLTIHELGRLEAAEGTMIHMTGSALSVRGDNPEAVAGLAHITFIFEGGDDVCDPIEAASAMSGTPNHNFALGALILGGSAPGHAQIVDQFDNGNRGDTGREGLVLRSLSIAQGSTLDLAGRQLCVRDTPLTELRAWIADGRLFDSTAGAEGWLAARHNANGWIDLELIPEPALWLSHLGDVTIDEEIRLTFIATASAPDPDSALVFSLDEGAPIGSTLHPDSGTFTWTPTEAQGPGTYPVTLRVTNPSMPNLTDTQTLTITVLEVNRPPLLDPIGPRSIQQGTSLTFTVAGSDPDIPPNALVYSLGDGAPAGAVIDPDTGVFTWTPSNSQGPGVYPVTVLASDDGSPSLNATETFAITVTSAISSELRFTSMTLGSNAAVVLAWAAEPGMTYRLETISDLGGSTWEKVEDYPAASATLSVTLTQPAGASAFFRVYRLTP